MMKRPLWSLLLATLIACGGGSKSPAPATPEGITQGGSLSTQPMQAPGDGPIIPLWPEVKKGTLPNGLTYYIKRNAKPEKRVALWLGVNAGSVLEDDDQRGLAHFIEHMAFNGTKRFPKNEIVNYLEKIGMGFGADLNAATGFDDTTYKLTVPTDNPEFVSKGLDILHDWAQDVSFDPAELEKERGVVLEEWRLSRGVQGRIQDKMLAALFHGSEYADRTPIGLPNIIKTAKRDRVMQFYKDFYRPDLMAIFVVGDVDPAAMEKDLQARFGDLKNPAKERPRMRPSVPKAVGTQVTIVTDKELPLSNVTIANVFAHRSERTLGDFKRSMTAQLYGQVVNERLQTLSKKEDSPFQFAQVADTSIVREVDMAFRTLVPKAGRVEEGLRAMMTEVVRVERYGFTEGELTRARNNITAVFDQMSAEASNRESVDIVQELTRNFYENEFVVGSVRERELTLQILPTITVADMNAYAKSVGGAEDRVILIAGPEGKPLPDKAKVLSIVDEVQKAKIDAWQETTTTATLMSTPPTPGKVIKEKTIASIGVTEWTLSNGARVVLKPTDFEKEQISISGDSPGGLAQADAKTWPDARFADDIASLGGVGDISDDDLEKLLAGRRLSVSASIGNTTESLDVNASIKDLETALQLMYLKVTSPRKDVAVFNTWKTNLSEQLANQRRQPEVQFAIESSELLYKKNPRRLAAVPADLEKIDLDRALAFYRNRFGDVSDFTFVIVGAFELDKIRPLVETYIASLPGKGRKEKEKDLGIRRLAGSTKKTWLLGAEPKARVQMQWFGDQAWSRDADRDIYILGQILEIHLREILREDMSGVYGVGAGGSLQRRPHAERSFSVQFGCAPDAVDALVKATQDEIARTIKAGTTPEYIEKVKAQFLRERETELKTNGFWSGWLSNAYRFNDDPTIVLDPSNMVARMTSANVKAAAKKYFAAKNFYQAVMLPAASTTAATVPGGKAPPTAPPPGKSSAPAPAPVN